MTSRAPTSWPQPPEPGQHIPGPSRARWVVAGVVGAGVTYLAGVAATLVLNSNIGAGALLAVFAAGLAIGTAILLLLIAIGLLAGLSRGS